MNSYLKKLSGITCTLITFTLVGFTAPVYADEDRSLLDQDIHAAIARLKEESPAAAELGKKAKGVLIFPNITKAGFVVGAQYGQGALIKPKQGGGYYIDEYFSITSASYGLQAGIQSYGYAMLLMSDSAVEYVETSRGWELGSGPSIVVVDEGMAKSFTTETIKDDVYAFTFGQEGLMAAMGLQGSKITRLDD